MVDHNDLQFKREARKYQRPGMYPQIPQDQNQPSKKLIYSHGNNSINKMWWPWGLRGNIWTRGFGLHGLGNVKYMDT